MMRNDSVQRFDIHSENELVSVRKNQNVGIKAQTIKAPLLSAVLKTMSR